MHCAAHHFDCHTARKRNHFQNQEGYLGMKKMVLKWSYMHHLLIKMEIA
jgi:hypothetical protein